MAVKTTFILLAAVLLLAPGSLHGQDVPLRGDWPPVRRGVWKLESTRVLPSGKKHRWTETQTACHNPTDLFMDYWGLGKLDRAGCRYYASKEAEHHYKIESECMVRRTGKVLSEARITVPDEDSFETEVTLKEGEKEVRRPSGRAPDLGLPASTSEPAR